MDLSETTIERREEAVGREGCAIAELEEFLEADRDRRMNRYLEFVRIPSVSALSEHSNDCRAAADWLAQDLREAGFEHVDVHETGGHPIVFGDWLHATDAPTVIVYTHYDVQPPDPLDLWETGPFDPIVRDGHVIARGAEDNKPCVQMHIRAAEAILRSGGRLPVNLKIVVDGEEEVGSPNLDAWLEANRSRIGGDLAVVSDTDFFDGNPPAICLGVRGLLYAQIDVVGPSRDLHSGSYGGAVRNPANALAAILGTLIDADGRVAVVGFYDDVKELAPQERDAIAALPFDEREFRESIGVVAVAGEAGYSTVERKTVRPTLDVNGMWSGFTGEGAKTIIPAEAHAKLSCRLVPNQDPRRVFEDLRRHVEAVAPDGVVVTVTQLAGARPSSTPIDHPATKAAAQAIESTFGVAPLYFRAGGSVPVTASFDSLLGLPVVLLGFAPPDSQAHAPNEFMDLRNFETGIRTIAEYWRLLPGALRTAQVDRA